MDIADIRREYFKSNESLEEVERIRQDIIKRGITNIPEHQLADAVLTLAMYMVNIGQLFVDLGVKVDDLKAEYDAEVDKYFLELKDKAKKTGEKLSDANAEKLAKTLSSDKEKAFREAQSTYNFVMRYYKDIERIISTAQSKMRVGSSEIIRSNAT